MERLVIETPQGGPFEHRLAGSEVVIGRAQSAGIVLADAGVSRHHARVFQKDGRWWAEDLGARNGTRLNDQLLSAPTQLASGDRLIVGGTTITFATEETIPLPRSFPSDQSVSALGTDRQAARMRTMIDVHRALATPISLPDLLELILDRCMAALHPEEAVVLLRGPGGDWVPAATKHTSTSSSGMLVSRRLAEEVAGRGKTVLVLDALMDERLAGAESIVMSGVRSVVAAPLADAEGSLGMIALGSRVGVKKFSQGDLDMLVSIASVAALRIRNVALAEEAAARKVLEHELALANEMQMSMLPRRLPAHPAIDLAARLTPARSVGGDLYDFVEDGDRLWFMVADVSGKGVAAALVTAVVKTLFRAMVPGETDLTRVLARMNNELCRDNDQMMFVTAMIGCLDLGAGGLELGDIGHNPAFLVGDDGDLTTVSPPKCIAFGVLPDGRFQGGTLSMVGAGALALYTDGVTDARSASGEMFGQARLERALRETKGMTASDALNHLYRRVESFVGGAPPEDDITMMVLRYRTPR